MQYLDILAPELVISVTAAVALILGVSAGRSWRSVAAGLSLVGLVLAIALTLYRGSPDGLWVAGIRIGWIAWNVRLIGLLVALILLLVAWQLPAQRERGEFFAMLLLSVLGLLLVGAADDLLVLLLALELVSVPTYVLVAVGRMDIRAQEAGVKYFFLGAMATGLTAYGFSFLYGLAGQSGLDQVGRAVLSQGLSDPLVVLGLALSMMGIAFKLAAVPLHAYVADVYQGAAAAVAAMLGFLPKFAGLVALIKLLDLTGWELSSPIFWLLWAMAAATMTVGNVLALIQRNVKRMLAYSSIAHSGYMLVGLLVGPLGAGPMRDGITAVLFYIAIYGVMNLGAFAVLACLQVRGQEAEDIDEIAGLARRDGVLALVMAICVFSLMGMPPTAGFLGKVYIFGSALASYTTAMIVLAVIGVVNSAIAAAYYLRIVGACYLRDPIGRVQPTRGFPLRLGMALCSVIVLAVGIGPNNLLRCTDQAGQDLQPARVSERVVVRPSPGAPSWLDRQDATADRPASAADPPPSNPPQAWRRF